LEVLTGIHFLLSYRRDSGEEPEFFQIEHQIG
jgi:hypothetical protein